MELSKGGYVRFTEEDTTDRKDTEETVRRNIEECGPNDMDMDNDVASTLGFPMLKSNLALIEAGIAKAPVVRKTGTTIVAAVYKDGVVMGGDSRSTAGNIIADKEVLKVHKLSETIYACGAGTSADLNKVTHWLKMVLQLDELSSGLPANWSADPPLDDSTRSAERMRLPPMAGRARVAMAVTQLSHNLYQYKGYIGAQLLIGGVDCAGVHLYSVSSHGSTLSLCFDADGSGGYAAISILERDYQVDMTEDECKALVQRALETGMHGDNASGNYYNLVVIDSDGARFFGPLKPSFAKQTPANRAYTFDSGATQVLEEKKEVPETGFDIDR